MKTVLILILALIVIPQSHSIQVIVNGGAEAGLTSWTKSTAAVSAVSTASSTTGNVSPAFGSRFFSFATTSSVNTQFLSQTFSVPNSLRSCSTNISAYLSFFIQTERYCPAACPSTTITSFDYANVLLSFYDIATPNAVVTLSTGPVGNPVLAEPGSYLELNFNVAVPTIAAYGVLTLQGFLVQGSRINVYFDDVALDLTCNVSPTPRVPAPPTRPTPSVTPTTRVPASPTRPTPAVVPTPTVPTRPTPISPNAPTPVSTTCNGAVAVKHMEARYMPNIVPTRSGIINYEDGSLAIRIVASSPAVSNRFHEFEGAYPLSINFLRGNCSRGTDYNYTLEFVVDSFGVCYEVYTIDLEWSSADRCGVLNTAVNGTCTQNGLIDFHYYEMFNQTRGRVVYSNVRDSHIMTPFNIRRNCNPSLSVDAEVRVYAPVFITAVIFRTYIPAGRDTVKYLYLETGIQRPFRLHLPSSIVDVSFEPSLNIATTLQPLFNESSVQVIEGINYQQWKININVIDECSIPNTFFYLPFETICENLSEEDCPIDAPGNTNITLFVNSQVFCTVEIESDGVANLNFQTFDGAFSREKNAFFVDDTVGVRVTAAPGTTLSSIEYLSAILSEDFDLPLFPPDFVENSFSRVLVSDGTVTADGTTAGFTVVGGSSNVFNFRFSLRSALFEVPADSFVPLRIGIRFA